MGSVDCMMSKFQCKSAAVEKSGDLIGFVSSIVKRECVRARKTAPATIQHNEEMTCAAGCAPGKCGIRRELPARGVGRER